MKNCFFLKQTWAACGIRAGKFKGENLGWLGKQREIKNENCYDIQKYS